MMGWRDGGEQQICPDPTRYLACYGSGSLPAPVHPPIRTTNVHKCKRVLVGTPERYTEARQLCATGVDCRVEQSTPTGDVVSNSASAKSQLSRR